MPALILPVHGISPTIGPDCFLADNATIIGDVVLGRGCTVWFTAVIRGDVNSIRIGDETNVQDGAVLHCTFEQAALTIGSRVSIGHRALVHGCTVHDDVLIGINVDKNDRTGYWRNGTYSKLENTIIYQVKLIGGKSYILGNRYTTDVTNQYHGSARRITADAIIIVDGQEQVLRTGDRRNLAYSMIQYNNDNYILVRELLQEARGMRTETIETKSFIYKNMKPMKLGDDITKLDIIDFAIIDK
jgi:hypothetical protein